ncbi:MAG: hypothetical protein EOR81_12350 [Mesorhizobium sp.]|nr:MAG: hypothetical protein EOR81_12350 [Mesorhizobium sp.]
MVAFLEYLQKEGAVVYEAPLLFSLAVVLAAGLIWAALRREFTVPITNLESELRLSRSQNEDYKVKLDGASPEQARDKIERLEARIAKLEHDPRQLTAEQVRLFTDALKKHRPGHVIVSRNGGSLECGGVQQQVRKLFCRLDGRWNIGRQWAAIPHRMV